MMKLTKRPKNWPAACKRCLALLLFGFCPELSAELTTRIGVATDYVYRGISQSSDTIALQGSVEYNFDSGVFAGVWLSQMNYEIPRETESYSVSDETYPNRNSNTEAASIDLEIDYFVGFGRRLSRRLAFDISLVNHDYKGSTGSIDFNWTEIFSSVYIKDHWIISAGVAKRWLQLGQSSRTLEISYIYPLPLGLIFDSTLGAQRSKTNTRQTIVYSELGVSRNFGHLSVRMAYNASEPSAVKEYGDLAKDRLLASLTWTF